VGSKVSTTAVLFRSVFANREKYGAAWVVGTYIVFSQKVEGAKHFVVLELEGAGSFEFSAEVLLNGRLNGGLLLKLHGSHLLLMLMILVPAGGPGRPP
jgi:hypothetical protein